MTPLGENYREYRTIDKAAWGRGQWQHEPDKAQWIDAATGLDCLIVRNRLGALCGYVGVPESHPWHGTSYNQCAKPTPCEEGWCGHSPESEIDVHGGLTFSDLCAETKDEAKHICHVPAPGRPDHVWWFGFDCAHSGDISPSYERGIFTGFYRGHDDYETYKAWDYVVWQVRELARQLAEVN